MDLKITGLDFGVTTAVKNHVTEKLERISRYASNAISVAITLSMEKVNHKAETDIHLAGRDLYVEAVKAGIYATVDVLMDKVDRAVLKYKEKNNDVRNTAKPATK